jgi:two-component system KDP operon response regulator KdpE
MEILIACADDALAALLACHARTLWPAARLRTAPEGARSDLIILDLASPPDGPATCRRLRAAHPGAPLLALGAHRDGADEVAALDAGADQYLPRDAHPLLLLAHLRTLDRRARRWSAPPPTRAPARAVEAGLVVDTARREARLAGVALDLTPTEYVLLVALAADRGRIVSHRTLLARVWGSEHLADPRYLKTYINRLRTKLADDRARPRHIQTCRGLGYRLHAPAA